MLHIHTHIYTQWPKEIYTRDIIRTKGLQYEMTTYVRVQTHTHRAIFNKSYLSSTVFLDSARTNCSRK